MSRDMTPKDLHLANKYYNVPDITDHLYQEIDGKKVLVYSDEDRYMSHTYPNFGSCGLDVLLKCKSFIETDEGIKILQMVEDVLAGNNIDDKELQEKTNLWYEGELCPGYYMDGNNGAFCHYLKSKLNKEI